MRCIRIALFLVAIWAAVAVPVNSQMVDAVVATVDKQVILYSDLMSQIGPELDEIQRNSASAQDYQEKADQLAQDALDNSIERLLMAREAQKYPQLAVSDKELDEYIARIREERGSTTEEFVQEVAGSMSEYREWVREQVVAQRMSVWKTRGFESEVVISDTEITDYYQEHRDEYERPERVYVRQIFLRASADVTERAQARAKLELIRQEVLDGADFEELAKLHSEAPEAELGGAIGWSQRGDFDEPLDSAAFSLAAGGLSDVLETQFGVNLLKVDKREDAGTVALADVKLEIEQILRQQAADKKYQTWLDDLRKRSRVRVFLR